MARQPNNQIIRQACIIPTYAIPVNNINRSPPGYNQPFVLVYAQMRYQAKTDFYYAILTKGTKHNCALSW